VKILFVTQNEAPFRMKWLDELAKYAKIIIFHLNDYEDNVNKKYISYHTKIAKTEDISRMVLNKKVYDYKKIFKTDYDILLLDGYGFFSQQLLILLLNIKKKKYGISVDGGFIPKNENILKKSFKRYLLKRASFYFSTSKETDEFLEYYGVNINNIYRHFLSNIHMNDIIQRPLSIEEKKELKKELGIKDTFTLIAVGKIIPIKGFDLLLNLMNDINFDLQLLIIGANDNESVNEYKKNSNIKVINFLSKEELNQYYLASDVFILPTRGDVWGLVIGEAMAKGLPVLTTNKCLAGMAMVKEDKNGYIFNVDDLQDMKKSIMKLYNSDLFEFGNESIEMAKKYCIENSAHYDYCNFKRINERKLIK